MATKNRRSKKVLTPSEWDDPSSVVRQEHEKLMAQVMSRMLDLGQKITMRLTPIGHDLLKTRRVPFELRQNLTTSRTEIFLPRRKLEKVIVIKRAVFEGRAYYLTLCGKVIREIYTVSVDRNELAIPIKMKKKMLV